MRNITIGQLLPAFILLCWAVFAASVSAQITTATVDIGGPGTRGSEGGDPPVLSDGVAATGKIRFTYDSSNGMLEVEVSNTTPQQTGVNNPVITGVYFNLPYLAVTGATFLGQTLAGGGTGIPMDVVIDPDTLESPNPISGPAFGNFNVVVRTPMGTSGAITNPDANQWSPMASELNTGPVTFAFQLGGPNLHTITAQTFATTNSVPPPFGLSVVALFQFQASGDLDGSGAIGTDSGCVPGFWYAGEPCLGGSVTLVQSVSPGCSGCVVFGFDPTPTVIAGLDVPFSPPYFELYAMLAVESIHDVVLPIPNDPALLGKTGYFVFAVLDPVLGPRLSQVVALTVCQ